MIQCFGSWFASLKYKSPPGKRNRRYTRKICWLKILKNKRPKVENFDHFDHVSCDKCLRDWNLFHVVVFYWQCTKNCYLAIGRILCCVSGLILLFNLFKCKFCKWVKLKVCSMPNPPPLPSVSTIPEESDSFIAPSHVEQNGHCTPHDLLFVLYLVFLEGQVFFQM